MKLVILALLCASKSAYGVPSQGEQQLTLQLAYPQTCFGANKQENSLWSDGCVLKLWQEQVVVKAKSCEVQQEATAPVSEPAADTIPAEQLAELATQNDDTNISTEQQPSDLQAENINSQVSETTVEDDNQLPSKVDENSVPVADVVEEVQDPIIGDQQVEDDSIGVKAVPDQPVEAEVQNAGQKRRRRQEQLSNPVVQEDHAVTDNKIVQEDTQQEVVSESQPQIAIQPEHIEENSPQEATTEQNANIQQNSDAVQDTQEPLQPVNEDVENPLIDGSTVPQDLPVTQENIIDEQILDESSDVQGEELDDGSMLVVEEKANTTLMVDQQPSTIPNSLSDVDHTTIKDFVDLSSSVPLENVVESLQLFAQDNFPNCEFDFKKENVLSKSEASVGAADAPPMVETEVEQEESTGSNIVFIVIGAVLGIFLVAALVFMTCSCIGSQFNSPEKETTKKLPHNKYHVMENDDVENSLGTY